LLKDISSPENMPCSFRIRNLQKLSCEIQKLSEILEGFYNKDIFCNLYYTPAATKDCFEFHADHQETYIYQLQGKKEWIFPLNSSGEHFKYVQEAPLNLNEIS